MLASTALAGAPSRLARATSATSPDRRPPQTLLTAAARALARDHHIFRAAKRARQASIGAWNRALVAYSALPDEDQQAAGQGAFYQMASLAESNAGPSTTPGQVRARVADDPNFAAQLEARVRVWRREHFEGADLAIMSGYANYARVTLLRELNPPSALSERHRTLFALCRDATEYCTQRMEMLGGAVELDRGCRQDLAQRLLI